MKPVPATVLSSTAESASGGNSASSAGPAFLIDFAEGYDESTQSLGDYDVDTDLIQIAYKPRNVRFDETGMTLEMVKTIGDFPFSSGEFRRAGRYGFGRYEVVMTASEDHGAVASFFVRTGLRPGEARDEIDFEFIARSPRHVNLKYVAGGVDESVSIPLWFDTAQAEHLYAFEWSPTGISWYVDGVKVHEVNAATAKVRIPTRPARVMANVWAGAGKMINLTGSPRFVHTSAAYRCMSHVPTGESGAQCSDTFKPAARPPELTP
jgi:hypothetical protein